MKKDEALKIMAEQRQFAPEHLCYSCVVGYMLLLFDKTWVLGETTQDCNLCPLYLKSWADPDVLCVCDKQSGNTRVHEDGFQTRDNGSGYWIVGCPYRVEYPAGATDEIVNLLAAVVEVRGTNETD